MTTTIQQRAMMARPLIQRRTITADQCLELENDPTRILAFGLYLSRACQMKCIHCLSDAGIKKLKTLSTEKRIELLEEARSIGATQLIISGAGEPLLDPDFWKIINRATELDMLSLVYSNTMEVTEEVAQRIVENQMISIIGKKYSMNTATSNFLFGGEFCKKSEAGYNCLIAKGLSKTSPTRLGFQCSIFKWNIKEIPDILRWARTYNLFPQINTLFLAGRAREEFSITREEYTELYLKCKEIDLNEFGIKWDECWNPYNPIIAGCCVRPKYWVMVDDVGEMRACSIDIKARIGDVANQGIKECLAQNAERVIFLRKTFQENDCFACNPPKDNIVPMAGGNRDLAR